MSDVSHVSPSTDRSKQAFLILFLSIFIDLIGFGLVLPLLPFYAQSFQASPTMITLLFSTYSLASFIANPFWGRLSDRIGRRPLLLLSLAGSGIAYLWFGLANSLLMLFLARGLAGIMGCSIVIAQAYIGDITTPENRSQGMGVIGAAFGLGFILGPALAGILVGIGGEEPNLRLPLLAAAGSSGVAFLLAWRLLPESRSIAIPSQADKESEIPAGSERAAASPWSNVRQDPTLLLLVTLSYLLPLGLLGTNTILALWLGETRGWGPQQVGFLFVFVGVIASIIQGGLIGPIVKRLGELNVLLLGLGSAFLGLICLPFAEQLVILLIVVMTYNIGESLCRPSLSSLLSQRAGQAYQGSVLGVAQSAGALGAVTGPILSGLLFQFMAPSAPFISAALLMILQSIVVWTGLRPRSRQVARL